MKKKDIEKKKKQQKMGPSRSFPHFIFFPLIVMPPQLLCLMYVSIPQETLKVHYTRFSYKVQGPTEIGVDPCDAPVLLA